MNKDQKIALIVVTFAIFTDMLVYGLIVPVLPKYASELGASQAAIGLMFASYAIAFLAATPVFGIVSDKIGRRSPMLLGLFGLAAATLLFAFSEDFNTLVLARSLQGISAAATWTAGLALLADMFPSTQRQQAIGLALFGSAAGTLLGPSFGGILFDLGGYRIPFLAAAGMVVADGIIRALYLKDPPIKSAKEDIMISRLLRNPTVLVVAGVVTMSMGIMSMLEPTLPLYLSLDKGATPAMIGLMFGVATLVGGIVSPLSFVVAGRFGRKKVMLAGLLGCALLLPMLIMPGSLLLIMVVMAAVGIALGLLQSCVAPELSDILDRMGSGAYASVYSVYNIALGFGMMFGPIAGGLLAGYFGLGTALLIAAAGLLAYALLLALGMHTRLTEAHTKATVQG